MDATFLDQWCTPAAIASSALIAVALMVVSSKRSRSTIQHQNEHQATGVVQNGCCEHDVRSGNQQDVKPATVATKEQVLSERKACTGPNVTISYSKDPLMIVRGEGVWLYDEHDQPYLDCVNNVAHVGHSHPKVVAAAQAQFGLINTNSRYLHPAQVAYARKLLATFPKEAGLDTLFMVCSGSEANDLALRLAKAYTKGTDVVVLGGAYHGHVTSMIEISPYKYQGKGGFTQASHVHKVAAPDVYRGPVKRGPGAGTAYAALVRDTIRDEVTNQGRKLAAFYAESVLGCAGQIVPPKGYLAAAFEHARAAGGVAIADEVQVGFGRCGTGFWAFDAQGAQPDIVTLGKPIGNGYPMAAVVTKRCIAEAFGPMEYFNTFGGSTAAHVIGEAVLDAIHTDQLQANAQHVGAQLLSMLQNLQRKHKLIGDVRGVGLFIGVELVRDRHTLEPAGREANQVAMMCRHRRVLISTDGPHENCIKIKPPMCFSMENAKLLVRTLDEALTEVASSM